MSSKRARETTVARRPWSLAARLTAWYAISAFALVVVVTGVVYWALVASLDREDDDELADKVRVLRAEIASHPGDLAAIREQAEWGWSARQHAQLHVRILDDGGQPLLETRDMHAIVPPEAFPDPLPPDVEPDTGARDFRASSGKPFRVVAARAGTQGQREYVIQAALDRTPEEELLTRYRRSLWVVLGVALVASAVGGHQIARRGIRPVEQITATARRIRPTTLGERLATVGLPAELQALAATFNEMLDRLEESFSRLARFSADIAHELRTPVNNLRGEAEVALGKPRSEVDYREALGSCLEESARLSRLIDSLLFLAQAENPQTHVEREPVDVGRELATVCSFYEAAASEAGIELTVAAPPGIVVDLNRTLLQRALGNLVANALAHTPPGGRVVLSADRAGGRVCVEVTDTGCGVPAEHLPHLFDRFYRVDQARSSTSGGVGLGLAIVKGIAELHGGSVTLDSAPGRGTRATLRFPAG